MRLRRRSWQPHIGGLLVSALFRMYRIRLRDHGMQELLAGSGIAVGVALVFGVLVANTSLTGSAKQAITAVNGSAQLQLAARSSDGFGEKLADEASRLPGVEKSAYLLRQNAVIVGPHGRQSIQLVGATPSLVTLGGSATADLGAGEALLTGGIGLPSDVGEEIHVKTGDEVQLLAGGDAHRVLVRAVLNSGAIGALANSRVAVALLSNAQAFAEQPGRVTQVLIHTRPGAEGRVQAELRRLAAGRVDVEPADNELSLLNATAKPTNQSTLLFAGISVMVGCLLAFNAMLLTVPERRRLVAELHLQGYDSRQLRTMLAFEAIMLGLIASVVGVVLGDIFARTLFQQVPIYLAVAFPISTHQVIHLSTVLIAVGCGVFSALVGSASPLLDLRRDPADAVLSDPGEPGQRITRATARRLGLLGCVLAIGVTIAVTADASLAVVGGIVLALAAVCLVPIIFRALTGVLKPFSKRLRGSMLSIAVIELDATTTRSVALAGVAALAIYGGVAIGGARTDLIHGLDTNFGEYIGTTDLWVTTTGNNLTINSFAAENTAHQIARLPIVSSVRVYQGQLLDIGTRRMWVIARAPTSPAIVPAGQLLEGNVTQASARLRAGGWVTLSNAFAAERDLHIGDSVSLPTPSGQVRFGVAAITTNIGWPPGTIIMSAADYSRDWQTAAPTALEVNLKPGVGLLTGRRAVSQVLAPRGGLHIQTTPEREHQFDDNARNGLSSLADIATLLLVTAALALALALSTAIWQRRTRLAALKTQGFDRWQLWRSLLFESAILLSIGCVDGAVLGIYGHALANRWLRLTTGFPAPFAVGEIGLLLTLALVVGISLAVIAVPGYTAAAVPAQATFQE
jgi:putative ABC transport system permease protein